MKNFDRTAANSILGVLVFAACIPAAFAQSTWNGSAIACGNNASFGNIYSIDTTSCVPGADPTPYTVEASAWSTATVVSPGTGSSTTAFTAAQLNIYGGGFGVSNQDEGLNAPSDEHTVDNSSAIDLVAYDFGSSKIKLQNVTIGYIGNVGAGNGTASDSDIAVLAYTGSGAASLAAAIGGKTIAQLVAANSGWTLVGAYSDLALNAATTINAGAVSSSWWLVSAYSTAYDGGTWSVGNDSFKIKAITGVVTSTGNQTPEPGSLALVGLAVVGMMSVRRRKSHST